MTGTSSGSPAIAPTKVEDMQDALYLVDITVGGEEFTVQMDTGSTDLWVLPNPGQHIALVNTTDIVISEGYGSGTATGHIQFAELEFAGFTVPSQGQMFTSQNAQYENLCLHHSFLTRRDYFANGLHGIMGLSFESISPLNAGIQKAFLDDSTTMGASPIHNILVHDDSVPSSFDLQIQRTEDLNKTVVGTLIVGSHLEGYEDITNQPKLPRVYDGRWSIPLDSMTVNGGIFEFSQSRVEGVDSGKIAVLLDSGFTLPPMPPPAVDFIYSSIPGAVRDVGLDNGQWVVPCKGTTNLTFTFAGIEYPVHYLDLAVASTTVLTINGRETDVTYCYNTYQYLELDPDSFEGFDAILGDAFLRNVYASFNYGEIDVSESGSYIQLMSTTDLNVALPDFLASRANTLSSLPAELAPSDFLKWYRGSSSSSMSNSISDSSDDVAGATDGSSTPSSSPTSTDDKLYSLAKQYGPVVIGLLAGNMLIGVLLCIIGLFTCMRRAVNHGAGSRSLPSTYAPVRFKEAEAAESGYRYQD
ncbi:hypothetical protein EIP86_004601 [Pleurotus ostreatoroseus]|nr:hypothetical protein EIP86_004601 [Pleurotus ostreatoroseus]